MRGEVGYLSGEYYTTWTATFQPKTKIVVFSIDFTYQHNELNFIDRNERHGNRILQSMENFFSFNDNQWLDNPYMGKGTVIKQEFKELNPRNICKSKYCVKSFSGERNV
jgi:hypothetical protein